MKELAEARVSLHSPTPALNPEHSVRWHDIWILYKHEMRSAFRERTIVVNALLMPVFLYPLMLWAMFSGMVFVEGLAEGFTSRVVVLDVPARHAAIVDSLQGMESVELQDGPLDPDEAEALVQIGDLDAVVEFLPPDAGGEALAGNFRVRVRYDRAVERSRRAQTRVENVVAEYRERWMADQARDVGLTPEEVQGFRVVLANVASERQMGALILGQMLPLFLVIMVALGCFVPSIDTTAGERERSTWETLMTVSASRMSIVTAKYFYVATLGILAGVLNVLAIFISIGAIIQPLLGDSNEAFAFSIPLMAVPVMIVGAIALALFFAAAMMILAAFARSFKDGQAMVTPVYWLALLPMLLGQQTDRTLNATLASIPIANVAMMIRDAINGVFLWPYIAQTLLVELVLVVACLLLAREILRFEEFLMGGFDGSFWRFAKERLLKRGKGAPRGQEG